MDLASIFQRTCDWIATIESMLLPESATGSYGRPRLDEPAPTMTTKCTTPACGSFIHPTEHRGITLREAATLQNIPANYTFFGTYGQIERQIGNAVPVKMAAALGTLVASVTSESLDADAATRRAVP